MNGPRVVTKNEFDLKIFLVMTKLHTEPILIIEVKLNQSVFWDILNKKVLISILYETQVF